MLLAITVFGGEIKVKDSDPPILEILEVKPDLAKWRPGMPALKTDGKPLLTVRSIRDLIVEADGKVVTMVLNESDSKKYAELTRKFQGRLLFFQLSEKPQGASLHQPLPMKKVSSHFVKPMQPNTFAADLENKNLVHLPE